MYTLSTSTKLGNAISSNYHHGNLREALVAAGLEILELRQSTEFSLRELTKQVGVTANAIYRHFANKDEILTALAIEGFKRLTDVQETAIQNHSNLIERFLAGGKAYINFARQNPTLFRLMYGRLSIISQNVEVQAAAQSAYNRICYGIALILDKPIEDAQVTIGTIHAWGLVHGLSHLIIDGQVDSHTTDIDNLIDAIMYQAVPLFSLNKFDQLK